MVKATIAAVFGMLAAQPAAAATFTYTGPTLQGTGTTGFSRIQIKFRIPGPILANTTYSTQTLSAYNDGVNRLPAVATYLARGMSYGGQYDSFTWVTLTTNAAAKPASWTFKVNVYYVDGLGNEGYDLYVNGPGNQQSCPVSACGYDSLYTTLPESLKVQYSFTSTHYGTLTYVN